MTLLICTKVLSITNGCFPPWRSQRHIQLAKIASMDGGDFDNFFAFENIVNCRKFED